MKDSLIAGLSIICLAISNVLLFVTVHNLDQQLVRISRQLQDVQLELQQVPIHLIAIPATPIAPITPTTPPRCVQGGTLMPGESCTWSVTVP